MGCKPKVDDYYPAKAIRLDEVGSVLVEFSVKGAGAPQDVAVLRATAPGTLQEAALRVIRSMRCQPDLTWMENGGPEKRIRVNVLFKLKGFDETAQRLDPDADEIVITGTSVLWRR